MLTSFFHLSVGERCRLRSGHVPSTIAHGVAELSHGVDSNVEKLANQRSMSIHSDFIRQACQGREASQVRSLDSSAACKH